MSGEPAPGMEESLRADREARLLAQTRFEEPLVLEAGAGTGKTAVLVARIVAWCIGPGWERAAARLGALGHTGDRIAAEVQRRVVAITFTEAAAAEMASRVGGALSEIARGGLPPGLSADALPPEASVCAARAHALVATLDQLVVRTIHGWCRRVLKAHPLDAGLHPRFEIDPDGTELAAVAREVVEARLPDAYGEPGNPDFLALARAGVGPADVEEALRSLLSDAVPASAVEESPLEPRRLRAFLDDLEHSLRELAAAEGGRVEGLRRSRRAAALARSVRESCERIGQAKHGGAESVASELEALAALWPDANLKLLRDWERGRFSPKGRVSEVEEALGPDTVRISAHARALRRRVQHLLRVDLEHLERGRRALAPLLAEAEQHLRRGGVQSFQALLRDARHLLSERTAAAERVRGEIDQLLVDEFQDTDALQCDLLRALALSAPSVDRPGLFLVGDPKQSIYGWRRADLRAYERFVEEVREAGGTSHRLTVSFRSVPSILEEVDRLIDPVMRYEPGLQPGYQSVIASEQNRSRAGFDAEGRRPVEHWVSWGVGPDGEPVDLDAHETATLEARAIARDLRELQSAGALRWGDAALLFRATGDLEIYLAALREAGIPYVVERDRSYYQRREVIDAAALVCTVLDPNDGLALVTLLRSSLVGVPDAALLPLWRGGFPGLFAELGNPESRARARALVRDVAARRFPDVPGIERVHGWAAILETVLEAVAALRAAFEEEPVDRFVERLRGLLPLELTEAARFLGAFRVANLDRFFRELADALEETRGDVATVLARLRAGVSEAREQEGGRPKDAAEDAVQVMTIHKAKGLDFEHVYVPQLHRGRRESAPASRAVPFEGAWEYVLFGSPTLGFGRARADADAVEAAERVRTLYVATTRAKSRLVLIGSPRLEGGASAESHLSIVARRRPAAPDLRELFGLVDGRSGSRGVDAAETRFVFPGVASEGVHGERRSEGTEPAAPADPAALERASSALLQRRAEARCRADRPIRRPASETPAPDEREDMNAWAYGEGSGSGARQAGRASGSDIGRAVGTAVHAALEAWPLGAERERALEEGEARARAALDTLLPPSAVSAARARCREILRRFASGPLHERLESVAPGVLARELPVLLAPDAADPEAPVGFVSGAVDLVYRDPASGEIKVVDYKTDAVSGPEALRERAERYRAQALRYARALREALGLAELPRAELWFLAADTVVPVDHAGEESDAR